jgi:hypothetical protein
VPDTDTAIIGADQFARMKPGALFLNLSRGHVVDVDALAEAVTSGRIAGAAVDATLAARLSILYDGKIGFGISAPTVAFHFEKDGGVIRLPVKSTTGDPAGGNWLPEGQRRGRVVDKQKPCVRYGGERLHHGRAIGRNVPGLDGRDEVREQERRRTSGHEHARCKSRDEPPRRGGGAGDSGAVACGHFGGACAG